MGEHVKCVALPSVRWEVDGYLGEVVALPLALDTLCLGLAPPLLQLNVG